MRILLVATAYNGLTQRAHIELVDRGHEVSITLALSEDEIRRAVALFDPALIICPFLKEKIPTDIFKSTLCIILHPGIKGDRGASSLDWAILDRESEWGATALQADEEMDAGDIWESVNFPMRAASKASLYRREVTRAAIKAMLATVERVESGSFTPEPLNYNDPAVRGRLRPTMKQSDRRIRWREDNVATILRKIHAADSAPGVIDVIDGEEYHLFGAHEEGALRGAIPGDIIAKRNGAICRAAIDGAVWISHLKKKNVVREPFLTRLLSRSKAPPDFKLPATMILGDKSASIPESPIEPLHQGVVPDLQGNLVRRSRWRRLSAFRLPQWRHEHGTVPPAARSLCAGAEASDESHRPHGRHGFLVERDSSQYDRGGGESGRRILAQHQRD